MASYSTRVKRDIARWEETGAIDGPTARALRTDVETNAARAFSVGSAIALLAGLLVGAAILIFIAANWQAFPRLMRVAMLFSLIAAGYLGGAALRLADRPAGAEALFLVAGAAFGASIALIGQMYHLSGDESAALLAWCAGVAFGAAALRSAPSTAAAVAIAGAWLWVELWDFWRDEPMPYFFLLMAAALWALSLWTRARPARHLLMLLLISYWIMSYLRSELLIVPILLAAVSAAFFVAATRAPTTTETLFRLGGGAAVHGLLGFGAAMMLVQFALFDGNGFLLAALVGFAGSIAALMLGGRDNRVVRWLSYGLFGLQLCVVYVATVGTMLGTAGFLLAAGAFLAVMAFFVVRMERRLNGPAQPQGGAA